jgi:hypothetical protein
MAKAKGIGEPPERSPAAILFEVDYPITRDDLAEAAADAGATAEAISFLRALPDRTYRSAVEVEREFAEADARFGLFRTDVHHRGDLGNEAMESAKAPTHKP